MRHAAGLTRLPVYPLLRPRLGDFAYSAVEVAMIADDIDAARDAGLTGVVIGASRDDGTLDADALGRLVKAAAGLDLTLHRAFIWRPTRLPPSNRLLLSVSAAS